MSGVGPKQLNGNFARVFDPLHRDFSLNALDAGKRVQIFNLKPTIGGDVCSENAKKEVAISRHQVALHDIWQAMHILREAFNGCFVLPGQPHAGEERHAKTQGFGAQDGRVSFDDASGLHVPYTPEAGCLRKPDLLCDLVAGLLAVLLQQTKNPSVDVVEDVMHGDARLQECWTLI